MPHLEVPALKESPLPAIIVVSAVRCQSLDVCANEVCPCYCVRRTWQAALLSMPGRGRGRERHPIARCAARIAVWTDVRPAAGTIRGSMTHERRVVHMHVAQKCGPTLGTSLTHTTEEAVSVLCIAMQLCSCVVLGDVHACRSDTARGHLQYHPVDDPCTGASVIRPEWICSIDSLEACMLLYRALQHCNWGSAAASMPCSEC